LLGRQVNFPKLSASFAGTQQVICGQNCTFLIQSNGSVLSIGEGSYGRLGLGNSDDMATQTIISALQGYWDSADILKPMARKTLGGPYADII